jgi:hypothetical protein
MSQIGSGLLTKSAPKFANYVVVKGTWKEKDNTQMQRTDDGDSAVYNYTFFTPGVDATCDLVVKTGHDPITKGSVLAESSPGTRSFVVVEADQADFGGMPIKQTVQLAYHTDFTPSIVT